MLNEIMPASKEAETPSDAKELPDITSQLMSFSNLPLNPSMEMIDMGNN